MNNQPTAQNNYRDIDFRAHPERYAIGRGEQGVLTAEPYKSEILPHWKFKTPHEARASAKAIRSLFDDYKQAADFVGMDMARKFLQMGWTRSRRYANHASGRKYAAGGSVQTQEDGSESSAKAESARIFKAAYDAVRADTGYQAAKRAHQARRASRSS